MYARYFISFVYKYFHQADKAVYLYYSPYENILYYCVSVS